MSNQREVLVGWAVPTITRSAAARRGMLSAWLVLEFAPGGGMLLQEQSGHVTIWTAVGTKEDVRG